jgi:hypothetical protein
VGANRHEASVILDGPGCLLEKFEFDTLDIDVQ